MTREVLLRTARIQVQVLVNDETVAASTAITVEDCPTGVRSLDLLREQFTHAKQDLQAYLLDFFGEDGLQVSQGINNTSWHAIVDGMAACNPVYTLRGDPRPAASVYLSDVCSHRACRDLWRKAVPQEP